MKDIPQTPTAELEGIVEAQQREATWWQDYPMMKTPQDIHNKVEAGEAEVIADVGEGYKISAKVLPEFRVLENHTCETLHEIAKLWLQKVQQLERENKNVFLVVTSLARTEEYQQKLIAEGYPAVENSTHTKLGAFDISVKWFKENDPELFNVLVEVLNEFAQDEKINVIDEPTIGVYHIAANPSKLAA